MKVYIVKSKNSDVFQNLALEFSMYKFIEHKFKEERESSLALFLWKNDKTIVLGRNQNVYSECNLKFCHDNKILISRRLTGGGAVFHDIGNLNFSFISSSDLHNLKNNYKIIQNALFNFGISSELSGRNDLTVDGKKFSGSAFYNSKYASLHHGTLLINTKPDLIFGALTPDINKLKAKGVDSVRSRVINLTELNDKINSDILSEEISSEFLSCFPSSDVCYYPEFSQDDFEKNIKLLTSSDWIFNPKFDADLELYDRFEWGSININLCLTGNYIADIDVYSDTLYFDIPPLLKKALLHQIINSDNLDRIFKELINKTTNAKKNKVYIDLRKLFDEIAV
ncbi:lipoate--protein ligase [bacterium]|nr:lipoate--protein ligase [bacterium]